MSIIIRLQNLPWSANAMDIRRFFYGLQVPDGGVHIVGGDKGDAFIAFSSDEDARRAMQLDRSQILNESVKLFLSSKSEMQTVISVARNSSDSDTAKTNPRNVQGPAKTPYSHTSYLPNSQGDPNSYGHGMHRENTDLSCKGREESSQASYSSNITQPQVRSVGQEGNSARGYGSQDRTRQGQQYGQYPSKRDQSNIHADISNMNFSMPPPSFKPPDQIVNSNLGTSPSSVGQLRGAFSQPPPGPPYPGKESPMKNTGPRFSNQNQNTPSLLAHPVTAPHSRSGVQGPSSQEYTKPSSGQSVLGASLYEQSSSMRMHPVESQSSTFKDLPDPAARQRFVGNQQEKSPHQFGRTTDEMRRPWQPGSQDFSESQGGKQGTSEQNYHGPGSKMSAKDPEACPQWQQRNEPAGGGKMQFERSEPGKREPFTRGMMNQHMPNRDGSGFSRRNDPIGQGDNARKPGLIGDRPGSSYQQARSQGSGASQSDRDRSDFDPNRMPSEMRRYETAEQGRGGMGLSDSRREAWDIRASTDTEREKKGYPGESVQKGTGSNLGALLPSRTSGSDDRNMAHENMRGPNEGRMPSRNIRGHDGRMMPSGILSSPDGGRIPLNMRDRDDGRMPPGNSSRFDDGRISPNMRDRDEGRMPPGDMRGPDSGKIPPGNIRSPDDRRIQPGNRRGPDDRRFPPGNMRGPNDGRMPDGERIIPGNMKDTDVRMPSGNMRGPDDGRFLPGNMRDSGNRMAPENTKGPDSKVPPGNTRALEDGRMPPGNMRDPSNTRVPPENMRDLDVRLPPGIMKGPDTSRMPPGIRGPNDQRMSSGNTRGPADGIMPSRNVRAQEDGMFPEKVEGPYGGRMQSGFKGPDDRRMPPGNGAPNDGRMPPEHRGQEDGRMPPGYRGQEDRRIPPGNRGQEDRRIPPGNRGQEDRRMPPGNRGSDDGRMLHGNDQQIAPEYRGPDDRRMPSGNRGPDDRRMPPGNRGPNDGRMPPGNRGPDDRILPENRGFNDGRMPPGNMFGQDGGRKPPGHMQGLDDGRTALRDLDEGKGQPGMFRGLERRMPSEDLRGSHVGRIPPDDMRGSRDAPGLLGDLPSDRRWQAEDAPWNRRSNNEDGRLMAETRDSQNRWQNQGNQQRLPNENPQGLLMCPDRGVDNRNIDKKQSHGLLPTPKKPLLPSPMDQERNTEQRSESLHFPIEQNQAFEGDVRQVVLRGDNHRGGISESQQLHVSRNENQPPVVKPALLETPGSIPKPVSILGEFPGGQVKQEGRYQNIGSESCDFNDNKCCFIRNLPRDVHYKDVRNFFHWAMIPNAGLKLINDDNGNRNGEGYIMFNTESDAANALERNGQFLGGNQVTVLSVSQERFDIAIDSFHPQKSVEIMGTTPEDIASAAMLLQSQQAMTCDTLPNSAVGSIGQPVQGNPGQYQDRNVPSAIDRFRANEINVGRGSPARLHSEHGNSVHGSDFQDERHNSQDRMHDNIERRGSVRSQNRQTKSKERTRSPVRRSRNRSPNTSSPRRVRSRSPARRSSRSTSPCLVVSRLPKNVTRQNIRDLFRGLKIARKGDAVHLEVNECGTLTGSALVEMETEKDHKEAVKDRIGKIGSTVVKIHRMSKREYTERIDRSREHDKKHRNEKQKGGKDDKPKDDKEKTAANAERNDVKKEIGSTKSKTENSEQSGKSGKDVERKSIDYKAAEMNALVTSKTQEPLASPLKRKLSESESNQGAVKKLTVENATPQQTGPKPLLEVSPFKDPEGDNNDPKLSWAEEVAKEEEKTSANEVESDITCVVVEGLPSSCTEIKVNNFFRYSRIQTNGIHLIRTSPRSVHTTGFVEFLNKQECKQAQWKNKALMDLSVISVTGIRKADMLKMKAEALNECIQKMEASNPPAQKQPLLSSPAPSNTVKPLLANPVEKPVAQLVERNVAGGPRASNAPTVCSMKASNLPFRASIQEIASIFRDYNPKAEEILIRYDMMGRPTGEALIPFFSQDEMRKAWSSLHQSQQLGRRLYLTLQ